MYRFRPHGMRVDEAIMECLFLSPFPPGERPPPAPVQWLDADSDWTKAPQLGSLARVFNQDSFNLPNVHLGLLASPFEHVTFARYEESKIRHWHLLLEEHLARP